MFFHVTMLQKHVIKVQLENKAPQNTELPVKNLKWGLLVILPKKGVFVAFLMQCRHNADQIGPLPGNCGPI